MSNKPELKAVGPGQEKAMTTEEMKLQIQAERNAREARAAERIKQVLQEERCVMNPVMILTPQGVTGRLEITAQE